MTSLVYHGTAPDTEPEFLALQQAATLGPAARLRLFSDTHSFGQVYLAPTPPNNAAQRDHAGARRAHGRRLGAQLRLSARSAGLARHRHDRGPFHVSPTRFPAGHWSSSPRTAAQEYGGLATHGHSGFILPDAEAARMRDDVARQYLLGFYRQSGPPAAVAARDPRRCPERRVVYRARWERERRRRAHARTSR